MYLDQNLLDPVRPLSTELSPSAITEANAAVTHVQQQAKAKEIKKRGAYIKFDEKTKIRIGKYSSENGISVAARHFSIRIPSIVYVGKVARDYECTRICA